MNSQPKEEPWIANFSCGVAKGDHKWAESECDHASPRYLDANFEEAFRIDDVASIFHYEPIARLDRLKFIMGKEDDDADKDFSGLLCEDEIANLTLAVYLPKLSEDHVMDTDVDFAERVSELDLKFYEEELNFGNSRSAVNYPETSSQVVGMFELSAPLSKGLSSAGCEMHDVVGSRCRPEPLSNQVFGVSDSSFPLPKGLRTTACEVQDAVESKWRHEPLLADEMRLSCSEERMNDKCPTVIGSQNVCCANDAQYSQSDKVNQKNQLIKINHLPTNCPFGEKAARARQKRSCHPPKRYADASPISKPRQGRQKKYRTNPSDDKSSSVMSQKNCHGKSSKRKEAKASKRKRELDSDDDYRPTASCFRKKKCNKQWTLDEVVKVVDGIARFGLGRWTAIQKTFFSSSCRNPTDIRDKWRNLVKTNLGNSKGERKDRRQKEGTLRLPNTIVERVQELAMAIPQCTSAHKVKLPDAS